MNWIFGQTVAFCPNVLHPLLVSLTSEVLYKILLSICVVQFWKKRSIKSLARIYDEIFIGMIPRTYGCSCFVFSDFCHSSRAALDERLWIFPPPCFRLMYTWSNVALLHWCVQFKEETAMLWDLVVVSKLSLIEFNSLGQFHTVTHRAFCSQGNSQATLLWRKSTNTSIQLLQYLF